MRTHEGPLVSIVTPAYNEEEHLRECIESVIAQTYSHWDYTIVNNCSTDRTREIAGEYAAKDPRIRLHENEEFVSVQKNYNISVGQISADSKYCKVLGADDWLYPDCLEKMVELAEAHPRVGIVSAYSRYGAHLLPVAAPFLGATASGREVCCNFLLGGPQPFGAPTWLLFRSDIVRRREHFFSEQILHADIDACMEVLKDVDVDFGFVHQILTFSRIRETSVSAQWRANRMRFSEHLQLLKKFGNVYLQSPDDVRREEQNKLSQYYNYLGSEFHERRGHRFWKMHHQRMKDAGYSLSMTRTVVNNVFYLAEAAIKRIRKWL